ncbi:nucleotidyltransferase family protein [Achromobacter seleniivolatilans]|uniref:Nucleotidyltransferase family protein n=1 Tax=Achromobacter seleniivolatilans TaxID=3047478 RepID=A0ABY9LWA7_9BURK|nr:nucleotidyltransferase family protein [Achromobacter sp. R39]WMD18484.1 nucleotidyltransferase family protein [Achromobacter sp. R39]
MQAMILAAGRGERMRPLTDRCPKPLLEVGGKPLIVWHLERLASAGIRDVVINHAWLGQEIERVLGDGSAYGVRIRYSAESTALETAGGIAQALPLLGDAPFLVINGDIWCDWNPEDAFAIAEGLSAGGAWLVLVDNPAHHPGGDFRLDSDGSVHAQGEPRLTFAGIGVYHPSLFADVQRGTAAPLAPLLRQAMTQNQAQGTRHAGRWTDVGTPQRLADLDSELRATAR